MRTPDENLQRVVDVLGLRDTNERVPDRNPFTPNIVGTYELPGRPRRIVELSHGEMGGTVMYGVSLRPVSAQYGSMACSDINEVLDYLLVLCKVRAKD